MLKDFRVHCAVHTRIAQRDLLPVPFEIRRWIITALEVQTDVLRYPTRSGKHQWLIGPVTATDVQQRAVQARKFLSQGRGEGDRNFPVLQAKAF